MIASAQLLAALPLPCLILDADDRVDQLNPTAEDLLQRSENALKGQRLERVFDSSRGILTLLATARQRQARVREANVEVLVPNQVPRLVSVDLSPMGHGRWLLLLIPEAPETPFGRAHALKSRSGSLTAMAGMLAHEINNPLAAIRGAAQLMADHNPELVDLIVAETDRITQLLDTLEIFSSPEDLVLGPVNVHAVLGETCQLARHSFGQHVRFVEDYDPSLPLAHGNAAILHRIFLNLIKNACEACVHGQAQVRLKTRYEVAERRRVQGEGAKTHMPLVISLIDNGPGIAPEMQPKVFSAFISSKDQGRGLGLAYVAEALAALDGAIDLTTVPGRTEFQLRFLEA